MQAEYSDVSDFREHFVVPRWKKPWPFAWRYGGKDQYDQVLKWVSQQPQLRSLELYIALEGVFSCEFRCTGGQGIRYFLSIIFKPNHFQARTGSFVVTTPPACRSSKDAVVL